MHSKRHRSTCQFVQQDQNFALNSNMLPLTHRIGGLSEGVHITSRMLPARHNRQVVRHVSASCDFGTFRRRHITGTLHIVLKTKGNVSHTRPENMSHSNAMQPCEFRQSSPMVPTASMGKRWQSHCTKNVPIWVYWHALDMHWKDEKKDARSFWIQHG